MKEDLLEILREPVTGASLKLLAKKAKAKEIWSGELKSTETGKRFPIIRGIPRFVPEENYATSFGYQWNHFSKLQLDSANGANHSRERLLSETLWSEEDLKGQWVLDAGCGTGRFSEVTASLGAKAVAMDYSSAVVAAAENLSRFKNANVVQGDIFAPPFAAGSLPFVFSLGVLQHTPNPEQAIRTLVSLLGEEGRFAFTIYRRRWYTLLCGKYLVRPMTKKMPKEELLKWVKRAMPVLFPATDLLYRVPVVDKICRFAIPVANYPKKQGFTRAQRYEEAILDTFDALSPAYDQPMSIGEVTDVMKDLEVPAYQILTKTPINLVGTAPRTPYFSHDRAPRGEHAVIHHLSSVAKGKRKTAAFTMLSAKRVN
jgi:SAM-dependent methyltransferase